MIEAEVHWSSFLPAGWGNVTFYNGGPEVDARDLHTGQKVDEYNLSILRCRGKYSD